MKDYNFKQAYKYVHEYDFPIKEHFFPYIDDMKKQWEEKYDEDRIEGQKTYNIIYENPQLLKLVEKEFTDLIHTNYVTSPTIVPIELNLYIQNQNSRSIYHNHLKGSSLTATLYLALPKKGGELSFIVGDKTVDIKVQLDKLYVFPSWLFHAPLPQEDDMDRICINLEFFSLQRPVHKTTHEVW